VWLNLILDPWIPVRLKNGETRVIRPYEMAGSTIAFPDWPRADLNVACLELLIGMVFLADPPKDDEDWKERQQPEAARLKERLLAFKDAFNLDGDGPRFMQDLEVLEGDANPPDMLFIDSAGANTAKNNADLMVRRERYETLDPALAGMALFAFQAFAPSGGAGNRTSMRGGGPMTTLVDPGEGLWSIVWANVSAGKAQNKGDLPWMRPTRVSDDNKPATLPADVKTCSAETLFGMPRRLRLTFDDNGLVNGVVQRPYGTNYLQWRHPFTPYYQQKPGSDHLPVHPKPGAFGYRNWLGIVAAEKNDTVLRYRATCVEEWQNRKARRTKTRLLIAGWAMDNMKPLDFVFSSQPLLTLTDAQTDVVNAMVKAADLFSSALRSALQPVCSEGEAREVLRENFYITTQTEFDDCVAALQNDEDSVKVATRWRDAMRRVALGIFQRAALDGLADRKPQDVEKIVSASGFLTATLAGMTKTGAQAYVDLELPLPKKKSAKEAA
jgi:CRISPR system Cascade subunit CasA